MNKFEKEVEQTLLNNEKAMLKQLETTYVKALADVKGRLRLLQAREETQSTIYQINYQKSLESQINAILGVLKQDNITNVQDFLNHMYEDGYIGIQYELMKQGVPVITSINQDEVSKSLFKQLGHMTFADRLNVNMNDFKIKIKDTITRGLASASTYKDIAAQLSLVTNEELYKSYRIARTEGHRITAEAKLSSMKKAKQQGADVVKQWDATLDGKTRKNHRKLDGEWVEVDEYFEMGGRKVKAPGKFGKAEEDINCRCILLTRPRWAVENETTRTKQAKISDEYGKEVEKLVKVKNYDEYKKGYYKVLEEDPEIEDVIKRANKRIANRNNGLDDELEELKKISQKPLDTSKWGERGSRIVKKEPEEKIIKGEKSTYSTEIKLDGMSEKYRKDVRTQTEYLTNKYNNNLLKVEYSDKVDKQFGDTHMAETKGNKYQKSIQLNGFGNLNEFNKELEDQIKRGHQVMVDEKDYSKYLVTHEFGHAITLDVIPKSKLTKIEEIKKQYILEKYKLKDDIKEKTNQWLSDLTNEELKQEIDVLNKKYKDINISEYAERNVDEFMAECFVDVELGTNTSKYSKRVYDIIMEQNKKWKP